VTTPADSTTTDDPAAAPAAGEPAPAETTAPAPATGEAAPAEATAPAAGEAPAPAGGSAAAAPAGEAAVAGKAVPLAGGAATLSPDNTKIQFVGTHSPPKAPDPRTGVFGKFSGKAQVDPATKAVQSVSVEIETASLSTPIDRLTNHLKSPDFFDVRTHPTARFASTKITPGEGGKATITGNLTLHGVTKEISFPASVQVTDEGLTLKSEFSIDRTQFGMTYKGVENKVDMTVIVGQ
jgi:polyisoprenoid-binding protein YceI